MIMDAAFGSLEFGQFLSSKGYKFTLGMNRGRKDGWIYDILENGLIKGEGRVAINSKGIIASLYSDNKAHTVITTAWKETGTNTTQQHQRSTEEESDDDHSSNVSDDNSLGSEERVSNRRENESDHPGAEWTVVKILERRTTKSRAFQYKVLWSTDETTWEPFYCFVDSKDVSLPLIQFAQEEDWINGFSGMTLPNLQTLCGNRGLTRGINHFSLLLTF